MSPVIVLPPPAASLPPPVGPTVLHVDDDVVSRTLVRALLAAKGYRGLEASRKSEAMTLLSTHPPDLVIVDGLLPDGTGLELIGELREQGYEGPVLFLSSFFKDFRTYKRLREDLKVAGVLHKPILPDRIVSAVQTTLTPGHAAAETSAP
jgi:DNA-binding response OmpR family regulator